MSPDDVLKSRILALSILRSDDRYDPEWLAEKAETLAGFTIAMADEVGRLRARAEKVEAGHDDIRKALGLDLVASTEHVVALIGRLESELIELRRRLSSDCTREEE